MENKHLVAVYGSLLSGLGNHRVMERAQGVLIGKGSTNDNIDLYSLGAFPSISLIHDENGKPVKVEVYEVGDAGMVPLNALEGYRGQGQNNFYERTLITINMDDGSTVDAYIYHIDQKQGQPIESGDWKAYLKGIGRYDGE